MRRDTRFMFTTLFGMSLSVPGVDVRQADRLIPTGNAYATKPQEAYRIIASVPFISNQGLFPPPASVSLWSARDGPPPW